MKLILVLTLLLSSLNLMADTTDQGTFFFSGNEVGNLSLNTEKTRTEYEIRRYQTTCYDYRCSPSPYPGGCRTVCGPGGCRTVCGGPGGGQVCRNIPYPCTREERIPVQVFDYFVSAQVKINVVGLSSSNGAPAEYFKVAMTGEEISMRVDSSKRFIVLLRAERKTERMNGNTKFITKEFDIELVDLLKITQAIAGGIKDFGVESGVLSYSLKSSPALLNHYLKVLKGRRMASDIILFDRMLVESEIQRTVVGSEVNYVVDMNNLGFSIPDRLRVALTVGFIPQGASILNENQLPALTASKDVLFTK
jgi:hypothetical protein